MIAAEERRAREAVEATQMTIDIDEIYREADRRVAARFSTIGSAIFAVDFASRRSTC